MKKLIVLIIVSTAFIACKDSVKGANGVKYKNPAEYNDYIVSRQTLLVRKIMNFGTAFKTNLDTAASLLLLYEKQTAEMIDEIKGMPPYKGDSTLREAAIQSFTFYKKLLGSDYKRLIEISKEIEDGKAEGVTEQQKILNNLRKEEEVLDRAFHTAQRNFASKHNMKLEANEMQKKLDKMNE